MVMHLFNCELEKYINIWFAHPTSNFTDIILFRGSQEKKASQFKGENKKQLVVELDCGNGKNQPTEFSSVSQPSKTSMSSTDGPQPTSAVSNISRYQILCSPQTSLSQAGPLYLECLSSPLLSSLLDIILQVLTPSCIQGHIITRQGFHKASLVPAAVPSTSDDHFTLSLDKHSKDYCSHLFHR